MIALHRANGLLNVPGVCGHWRRSTGYTRERVPDSHLTGPTQRIYVVRPVAPDQGWTLLDRRHVRREIYHPAALYRRLAGATFLSPRNLERQYTSPHFPTKVPLSSRGPLIVIPPSSSL